jgi:transposase
MANTCIRTRDRKKHALYKTIRKGKKKKLRWQKKKKLKKKKKERKKKKNKKGLSKSQSAIINHRDQYLLYPTSTWKYNTRTPFLVLWRLNL